MLLFVLYRLLVQELGIEAIGVWSLVLATCSLARLGEFGMAGGLTRFVGNDLGAGKPERAARTVFMSACFLVCVVGLCCVLGYPLFSWIISKTIKDPDLVAVGHALLPWTLAATWMAAMVNLLVASLDGNQRTVLRALAMMTGGVCQLLLAWHWVPVFGLSSLGWLQLSFLSIQAILLLFALLYVMRLPLNVWLGWERMRFLQLLRYGAGLQVTTVGQLLFEPTVRWLLSIFSGLVLTGYYELASKAIVQFRLAITAAFQMIVPFYATQIGRVGEGLDHVQRAYRRTLRLLLLISLPYFIMIGCSLPFILTIWTGSFSEVFVWVGFLCLGGWLINTFAVPAFMLYLAIGRLRWIAVTQFVIGCSNLLLGLLLGQLFGGMGVVSAAMLALVIGSAIVVIRFHIEFNIDVVRCLPNALPYILSLGLASVAIFGWHSMQWRGVGYPAMWAVTLWFGVGLALLLLVWKDPLREELFQRLLKKTIKRRVTT